MTLSTQPYKGARDFYPEDKRLQNYIFSVWKKVSESYGYEQYDSPMIEPLEVYKAKTGEEIVNEQLYSFKDRGDREVAIRPEMTPSVSRMVAARRQELAYPLRLYAISNLLRYERPQRGRLREHWQLNVDIFGEEGLSAEHEMICMASDLMKAFGAKDEQYIIRINSRKYVDGIFADLKFTDDQKQDLVKLIDKKSKIESDEFEKLISETAGEQKAKDLLKSLDNSSSPPAEIEKLLNTLSIKNVVFDPSLMRGFDYYTDIVFEVFDTNPDNNRSMFGGGRYDGLVGLFGVEPLPTVGFGMGDVTLANFLETNKLIPELKSTVDVALILIDADYTDSIELTAQLRQAGLNVSVDPTDRKLDKKIKSASKTGVKYALFVGKDDLKSKTYNLKDLSSGKEQKLDIKSVVNTIKGS